jgi:acyl-CoA thioester hydrolase
MILLEHVKTLPQTNQVIIPSEYLDEMGHMNIQWYIALFDRAAWHAFGLFGATLEAMKEEQMGAFALQQHITYLAEVRLGEQVSIYTRFIERSEKQLLFMHFMVNDSREMLASYFESLGMSIDMKTRRSAPWSEKISSQLDALLAEHQALDWQPPLCGVLKP